MKKEVTFDPDGAELSAEIIFKGEIYGSFILSMYEKDSNNEVIEPYKGNNLNQERNIKILPIPVSDNDQRYLSLDAAFKSFSADERYSIDLIIYQGGEQIGIAEDPGATDGSIQNSMIWVELIANN